MLLTFTYISAELAGIYSDLGAALQSRRRGAGNSEKLLQIGCEANGEALLACLQSGAPLRIPTNRAAAAVATLIFFEQRVELGVGGRPLAVLCPRRLIWRAVEQ